jgi:hypothetical protein
MAGTAMMVVPVDRFDDRNLPDRRRPDLTTRPQRCTRRKPAGEKRRGREGRLTRESLAAHSSKPKTQNPKPKTQNPKPKTLHRVAPHVVG